MNRTITMNLSGIIFHIEEDAYDKLNKYLSTIRSYFKDSDGREEIMSDIEARIAEMLQEKVSKTKQAVLMMDVESVIAVMGKPEDFAGEGDTAQQNTNSSANDSAAGNGPRKRRRVFRDTDDKLLGGVCSGIANYFDFDPLWLRAAFAVSFFAFGSGFLLYVILWIIIPEAKTTAEKLEMRGEKVDVNNIGKVVNEEFEDFKKRMKDFGQEVGSKENAERVKSGARKASEFVGDVFINIIKIFGKIVAAFLVFIGIVLLIALLATVFGSGTISPFDSVGNVNFSLYQFSAAVLPENLSIEIVVIGLILFAGIPLLSIIYAGIKHLFGIQQKNRIVRYTGNILWLLGLGIMIYVGIVIGNDFREETSNKQQIHIEQPKNNVLYLDVNPTIEDDIDIRYNYRRRNYGGWTLISKDDKTFSIGYPIFNIVPSETDSFELVEIRTATGIDKKAALYRAKSIDYEIRQTDSLVSFNSYFDIKAEDKLRAQDLKLILKVPVNKIIYMNKRMEKIIYDIDNVNDALDNDMLNRRWIMTKQGLECLDCEGLDKVSKAGDTLVGPPPPPPLPVNAPSKK